MSPRNILEGLCSRHGLPVPLGERLLPLIQRALDAPLDARGRILRLVEATIRRDAGRYEKSRRERALDERMLGVVAKVVHRWTPPAWLLVWTKRKPGDPALDDERDIA